MSEQNFGRPKYFEVDGGILKPRVVNCLQCKAAGDN